ncbi:MAG TPA: DinB family protein [Vicinamibacterales bacterium]|nr:DinB family protein [Vicinamibacterales bacterium]
MSVFTNPANSTAEETATYVSSLLGLLGDRDPVAVLAETPAEIERLLATVPAAAVTTPEAPGKWSIREVVQHLADSELVGGWRLRLVLAQDRPALTGYDQDLWASRLRYDEVDVGDAFDQFAALRKANLRLWRGLTPDDLSRVGLHSERGEESLAHLRKLYAAHDLLHRRQLARIRAAVGGSAFGGTRPTPGT